MESEVWIHNSSDHSNNLIINDCIIKLSSAKHPPKKSRINGLVGLIFAHESFYRNDPVQHSYANIATQQYYFPNNLLLRLNPGRKQEMDGFDQG